MLLNALQNYISIILVKYHIFLHDFFGLAEMDKMHGFNRENGAPFSMSLTENSTLNLSLEIHPMELAKTMYYINFSKSKKIMKKDMIFY